MSDILKLNCWVAGDEHQSVRVNIPKSDSVSDLKKAIKTEKPQTFLDIEADSLVLWKISIPFKDFDTKLSTIQHPRDADDAVLLWPFQDLAECFTMPPTHEHIHIIVQRPAAGTISASSSGDVALSDSERPAKRPRLEGPDLSLWCWVEGGKADEVFEMNISGTKTVSELKELIWEKSKPAFDRVPTWALKIFKTDIDMSTGLEDSLKFLRLEDGDGSVEMLQAAVVIQEVLPNPVPNHLHVVVGRPTIEPALKRNAFALGNEQMNAIRGRWAEQRPKMMIPPLVELKATFERVIVDDQKIPIPQELFDNALATDDGCQRRDMDSVFRVDDTALSISAFNRFLAPVKDRPPRDGTKNSYHSFWDRNVRDILQFVYPEARINRNSSQHRQTRAARPDFVFLLNECCIFRGEEKAPSNFEDAKKELSGKLQWAYEPAPYILGYYCRGTALTYVAIVSPSAIGREPTVHDIIKVDLATAVGRVKNIRYLINLSTLLEPLTNLVDSRIAEYEQKEREGGQKTVEIAGRVIIKRFKGPNAIQRVARVAAVYKLLEGKGVRHTDRITFKEDNLLILEPRGRNGQPSTEKELCEALVCVLEALVDAHASTPIFHRDIRWPNVIQSIHNPLRWFLIDWEDASAPPTKALPDFSSKTHSPKVFCDGHGFEVDIWGVGALILNSRVVNLSPRLRKLGTQMQQEPLNAEEALTMIRKFGTETN